MILFIIYLIFLIYYCFKEINPIKISVSKYLFLEENKDFVNKQNLITYSEKKTKTKTKTKTKVKFQEKSKKGNYPPKKGRVVRTKSEKNFLRTENYDLLESQTKSVKPIKTTKELVKSSTKRLKKEESEEYEAKSTKPKKPDIIGNKFNKREKKEEKEQKKDKILDDFELNNLGFNDACELDKRSFCKTYWSVLKREHIALLTFFSWNDYNLFYIKFNKFLIIFCTEMTMNGLFFVHESMHKKYTEGEDFTFVQKIPQLIFTVLVSNGLEVILCFLSMTDVHYYEIKALPKDDKVGDKIINILDCIRRKLVSFIIFTFLLFLFHWYFISAFCAVYQNTQKIFLRDSLFSFLVSLIEPFIIYAFTTCLRCISLTRCIRKSCCSRCIYKLSDVIPIF